jgi:predicted enzyme related to lactoylglutathione lyase
MVYVRDMERAVPFYRDVLGLPLQMQSPGWSQFDLGGGMILGLHVVMGEAKAPQPGWVPSFQVDDVKAAKQRLVDAGATIALDFHDIPNGVVLECLDPDGNPIDLMQPGISCVSLGAA